MCFVFQYLRLADTTDTAKALKLMIEDWRMGQPELLISVTGGANSFIMMPKLRQLFNEGLQKVNVIKT